MWLIIENANTNTYRQRNKIGKILHTKTKLTYVAGLKFSCIKTFYI